MDEDLKIWKKIMERKKLFHYCVYEKPFENTGQNLIRIDGSFSTVKMSTMIDNTSKLEKSMKNHSNAREI